MLEYAELTLGNTISKYGLRLEKMLLMDVGVEPKNKEIHPAERYAPIFCATAEDLLNNLLPSFLLGHGYKNVKSSNNSMWTCAAGDIPVLLVAHCDTTHKKLPETIYYDKHIGYFWAPEGLGADDRAGVAAILEIINCGFKPWVLFTNLEESGCVGARAAVEDLVTPEVKYIIEFDRKGANDAVFYGCGNKDFQQYVLDFGFHMAEGSFTDITTLCPKWDIAGVNLSIGYYNAHTKDEYLVLDEWLRTVTRAEKMLMDAKNVEAYDYQLDRHSGYGYWFGYGFPDEDFYFGSGNYTDQYEEITVFLNMFDLASEFGGFAPDWRNWVDENHHVLHAIAQQAIREYITEFGIVEVVDGVEIIEDEEELEEDIV